MKMALNLEMARLHHLNTVQFHPQEAPTMQAKFPALIKELDEEDIFFTARQTNPATYLTAFASSYPSTLFSSVDSGSWAGTTGK